MNLTMLNISFFYMSSLWFLAIFGVGVDFNIIGFPAQRIALVLSFIFICINLLEGEWKTYNLKFSTYISVAYLIMFFLFIIISFRVASTSETFPYLPSWDIQNFNGIILTFTIFVSFTMIPSDTFIDFIRKLFPVTVFISILLVLFFNGDVFSSIAAGGDRLTTEMRLGSSRSINNINYWSMAIGLIPAILIYVSGLRVFTYITLAALVVCLMMTFSRSGMLIALLAISFPFFKKIKLSHLIIILIAISIATSIFLMTNQISSLVPNEDNVFSSRVIGVFSGEDESALGRLSVYFEIISDYQNIFGYGADYAQIISHPTESFVLNALMSIGIISLPCIGVFVFINVYFSKFSSQTSQISQIPILLVVIWFLDDPFLSLTVSLSLVTYQRLLLINEN